MPPNLDIYVISPARNPIAIEIFLCDYVDRPASEDRGDEELMMLPLGARERPGQHDAWKWLPVATLQDVIDAGLRQPLRAFSVALKAQDPSLAGAQLAFTSDEKVVFGLSIDDEGCRPEHLMRAKLLLNELARKFDGESGFIGVEEPAPITGKIPAHRLVLYTWPPDHEAFGRILNRKGGEAPRPEDSLD